MSAPNNMFDNKMSNCGEGSYDKKKQFFEERNIKQYSKFNDIISIMEDYDQSGYKNYYQFYNRELRYPKYIYKKVKRFLERNHGVFICQVNGCSLYRFGPWFCSIVIVETSDNYLWIDTQSVSSSGFLQHWNSLTNMRSSRIKEFSLNVLDSFTQIHGERIYTVHDDFLIVDIVNWDQWVEFRFTVIDGVSHQILTLDTYSFIRRYPHLVEAQSGMEIGIDVKYGKSKYARKKKSNLLLEEKNKVVASQLAGKNLGSRKKDTKKKFLKRLRTNHIDIEVQGGKEDYTTIISAIEKFLGLYCIQYWDKPIFKAISALLLVFQGSIACSTYNIVKDLINSVKNEKWSLKNLSEWLKSLVVDIDCFKNNKYAQSFVSTISKFYLTFLCPTITTFLTPILETDLVKNILNCFTGSESPLETIINMFTYLTNGVDTFLTTGEMTGFIITETKGDEFILRLREVRQNYNLYRTGDLEFIKDYKHYSLLMDMDRLKTEIVFFGKSKRGIDQKQVNDWIKEIDTMMCECEKVEAHSKARIQPYHFILSSGSGISKTHLVKLICNTIAIRNGFPHGPEYTYYLNQSDKFQSGWKNFVTIVIVDDSAAMRSEAMKNVGVLLPDWLLRGANNVKHNLLASDIREKGALFNRSLVEGWASNSFDQEFHVSARFPSAINRRFQMRIIGKVRPQYTKTVHFQEGGVSSMIDYAKIPEDQRDTIAPDAWVFTCLDCQIRDNGINYKSELDIQFPEHDNDYKFVPFEHNGRVMENVDLGTMLNFMADHSEAFFKQQEQVLKIDEKVHDIGNYCSHGIPKSCDCNYCELELQSDCSSMEDEFEEESECEEESQEGDESITNSDVICSLNTEEKPDIELPKEPVKRRIVEEILVQHNLPTISVSNLDRAAYRRSRHIECLNELSNFTEILCQDGKENNIESLLYAVRSLKISTIMEKIKVTNDLLTTTSNIIKELINSLKTWFDEMVCDILEYFAIKLLKYVADFVENPTSFIPTAVEGTIVGAYCYAKHPLLRIPMAVDYCNYLVYSNAMAPFVPRSEVPLSNTFTNLVYTLFLKSKTVKEKLVDKLHTSMSFGEYCLSCGLSISKLEKDIKKEDPDILRDLLLPGIGSYLILAKFLPSFCTSLRKLYCTAQVGYEIPVSEIAAFDNRPTVRWYDEKVEKKLEIPTVLKNSKFNILEQSVVKNSFYVKDVDTLDFVTSLSPCNKFLILPKHFVEKSAGKIIRLNKVEVMDENRPGNAYIEIVLNKEDVTDLEGDSCLLYLPEAMDHMRTKSLVEYFPSKPNKEKMVGKLHWKEKGGVVKSMDATDIEYSDDCYNTDKNTTRHFSGYFYKSDNFKGLCGAVLIDHTHKSSSILGIHVGGNSTSRISVAQYISRTVLEKALASRKDCVLEQQSGFNTSMFGSDIHTLDVYKNNPFLVTDKRIDGVEIIGTIHKRYKPESRVVYTPIYKDVVEAFKIPYRFGPAPFTYGGDKRYGVNRIVEVLSTRKPFSHFSILEKAKADYIKSIDIPLKAAPSYWKDELVLLDDFQVVNGVASKKFMGGLNMSSAFGAYYPGIKSKYATQVNDVWILDDFVMEAYHKAMKLLEQGQLTYDVYVQMLKNEATAQEKIDVGKVRSFYMCSIITQMILRRYSLSTCRFFFLNTIYSEATVGINPHGTDWHKMVETLRKFNPSWNLLALDLKNFDLTTQFRIVSAAVDIIFYPIETYGNLTSLDRNVIKCLKHIMCYSVVNMNGDLVIIQGLIPSGTNLTSLLGCIINSLNYRMAYFKIIPKIPLNKLFRDDVALRTFGDDSVANVVNGMKKFNVSSILDAWDAIGIQGTDLSKGARSNIKFYSLSEIEFLKRKLYYDKNLKVYTAPLELKSAFKCLLCHVPPKTMSIEAITGQCVDNFLFEVKFYGKTYYEIARPKLKSILIKHDLLRFSKAIDLTYEDQIELWRKPFIDENLVTERKLTDIQLSFRRFLSLIVNPENWFEWTQNTFRENEDQNQSVVKLEVAQERAQIVQQSGVESQKEQVLDFVQQVDRNNLNIGGSVPASRINDDDVSLHEFLKRPVLIKTAYWGPGIVNESFDPWLLLMKNKRVANKIAGYTLFKGKCHVKFVLNGNSFYYGKIMASYLPFSSIDAMTFRSPLTLTNRVGMSQCPKVFLDATTSEGAEMMLPFFYPADYVDLTQADIIRSLGTIILYTIADLKHMTQDLAISLNFVTISVYAWFEDVELQGPTVTNPTGIAVQSGREKREKEAVDKPISQACTAIAKASKALATIPIIAPYALSVEMGASIASSIASKFGYCKPNIVQEPCKFIGRPTDNTAVTNTTDNSLKLAVDVKQQTTIDPRIVGLDGRDELSIQRIASIDSFLCTFPWTMGNSVGNQLFSALVTPMQFVSIGSPSLNYVNPTAICGASIPFSYWTGSIKFKFQIVSSAFHRGRLAIVYDPLPVLTGREDNMQFTHIVDIGETREVEVEFGVYKKTQWLEIYDSWVTTPSFAVAGNLTSTVPWSNGVLNVYVLNELTTASYSIADMTAINTDIQVAVYVSAGDDFRLSAPSGRYSKYLPALAAPPPPSEAIETQSGLEPVDPVGDNSPVSAAPHTNVVSMNTDVVYMGETIDSFRTLLKRYNYYATYIDYVNGGYAVHRFFHQAYPLFVGAVDNFPATGANRCCLTLWNYLATAFAGWRGGMRWKLNSMNYRTGQYGNAYPETITVSLQNDIDNPAAFEAGASAYVNNDESIRMINDFKGKASGTGLVMKHTSPCTLDFEMPYYTALKFNAGKPLRSTDAKEEYYTWNYEVYCVAPTTVETTQFYELYCAGAEDTTFFFFTGWPPIQVII